MKRMNKIFLVVAINFIFMVYRWLGLLNFTMEESVIFYSIFIYTIIIITKSE